MHLSTCIPKSQFGLCSCAKWMRCRILTTASLTRLPFWQGERGHYIHLWDAANINLVLKETHCAQKPSHKSNSLLDTARATQILKIITMQSGSPKYDRKQSILFIVLCGILSVSRTNSDVSWGFLWQTNVAVGREKHECQNVSPSTGEMKTYVNEQTSTNQCIS